MHGQFTDLHHAMRSVRSWSYGRDSSVIRAKDRDMRVNFITSYPQEYFLHHQTRSCMRKKQLCSRIRDICC